MYRAGGSLTNVSVNGISHGNGVQEGNAISIRNRVSGDDTNVPRAQVALDDIDVTNYQKTGLLLDGNLTFTVTKARIGQGAGPQGEPNPTIAANSLQVSRGASGSVSDSTIKLNSHEQATAALLYNAKKVDFNGVTVNGDAPATTGINVSNDSNTVDTTFTMRGGAVTRTAAPEAGIGVTTDGASWLDHGDHHRHPHHGLELGDRRKRNLDHDADHPGRDQGRRQRHVQGEPPERPAPAHRHEGVAARGSPGRGQAAHLDDQGRRPLERRDPPARR